MTKRMGRPKLPPNQRREEILSIRFTKPELAKIRAKAKQDGLDPREWGRKHLLSESK
jgi:hypothetical protein